MKKSVAIFNRIAQAVALPTPGQSVLAPRRIQHPLRGVVFAILLSFSSHCFAQATAPAAPAPQAIEGEYEHQTLMGANAASSKSANARNSASPDGPASNALDIRRVIFSLGIVLALVFACRWLARWLFPSATVGRSTQVMKVLSRSVIAPKQQLLLIQVGRRLVVVGDSGQQMNALAEISDPDEVASLLGQLRNAPAEAEPQKSFDPLLGQARLQFDDSAVPGATDPDDDEPELAVAGVDETRGELSGLTEKIRMLSRQLGKT